MNKLMSANLARMKKNKPFWICMIAMFVFGALFSINQYMEHIRYGLEASIDNVFFGYAFFIGILCAVFSSLFLGTEYSDGTIRNKLVVGHTRTAIYLSSLCINIIAAMLMCAAFLVAMCVIGIPLLGLLSIDAKVVLFMLVGSFTMVIAFCSIFTFISMICHNKAIACVISILGVVLLILFATMLKSRIDEPEFYDGYVYVDSQGITEEETTPNPQYLTGTKRAVYEFIFDLLPTGQAVQYYLLSPIHLWRLPILSVLIIIVTNALGVFTFRKKDIK